MTATQRHNDDDDAEWARGNDKEEQPKRRRIGLQYVYFLHFVSLLITDIFYSC